MGSARHFMGSQSLVVASLPPRPCVVEATTTVRDIYIISDKTCLGMTISRSASLARQLWLVQHLRDAAWVCHCFISPLLLDRPHLNCKFVCSAVKEDSRILHRYYIFLILGCRQKVGQVRWSYCVTAQDKWIPGWCLWLQAAAFMSSHAQSLRRAKIAAINSYCNTWFKFNR